MLLEALRLQWRDSVHFLPAYDPDSKLSAKIKFVKDRDAFLDRTSMVSCDQDSIQLLSAESDSSGSSSSRPNSTKFRAARRTKLYRGRQGTEESRVEKNHIGAVASFVSLTVLLIWIILLTVVTTRLYGSIFEIRELTNKN
ncbi:Hypothetical protein NTJ_02859 [Nesidiocoris tenuis]|uniref:Uncharacterized protein n=1 Tax=Nesidiocoris tenuis TaxID=355587 RepID=A0ABN7AI95_9HEMI|nr:Hypothetical protein NTJ_02859 [Nesidiocoris tenuis]